MAKIVAADTKFVREPNKERTVYQVRISEEAQKFGFQIDPDSKIFQLSMGERQRVEILKLLYRNCRVFIFDEPTAVLTPQETQELFQAIRALVEQGRHLAPNGIMGISSSA